MPSLDRVVRVLEELPTANRRRQEIPRFHLGNYLIGRRASIRYAGKAQVRPRAVCLFRPPDVDDNGGRGMDERLDRGWVEPSEHAGARDDDEPGVQKQSGYLAEPSHQLRGVSFLKVSV